MDDEQGLLAVERITLYHAFVAACERAGVEDFTWHDLRHEALLERACLSSIVLKQVL